MTTEPAPCPICEARADVTRPQESDQLTVSCWECGCFEISCAAATAFKGMAQEGRRASLAEAKNQAPPGQVPEVKAHPSQ
jgi:hypothetical protein